MTQEEKQLLLKDLCARLPYGVKCYAYQSKIDGNDCECCGTFEGILYERFYLSDRIPINGGKTYDNYYLEVKPYLRPLSSMTEEEKEECVELGLAFFDEGRYKNEDGETIIYGGKTFQLIPSIETFDWLNAHHFDYRGWIEKGMAIEAPEGMYNV